MFNLFNRKKKPADKKAAGSFLPGTQTAESRENGDADLVIRELARQSSVLAGALSGKPRDDNRPAPLKELLHSFDHSLEIVVRDRVIFNDVVSLAVDITLDADPRVSRNDDLDPLARPINRANKASG